MATEWVEVQLRWRGGTVGGWYAVIADPGDMDDMRKLGAKAVRRDRSWQKRELGEYEVRVRSAGAKCGCAGARPMST
jgi:hypothetical protein